MATITVDYGAATIGGNKIYVKEGGRNVFLDFGKNFRKYGRFYEEYLKNRTTRGIHDLLHLGLIHKLNIYRPDLVPPDISLSTFPKLDVKAVLSHAHLELPSMLPMVLSLNKIMKIKVGIVSFQPLNLVF